MVFVVAGTIQKTIYVEEGRQGRRSSMTSRVDSCFGEAGLRRSASPSRALRRDESPSRVVKSSADVPCFPGKATGEPDKTYIQNRSFIYENQESVQRKNKPARSIRESGNAPCG